MSRIFKEQTGSVLMETVVAMPLHIMVMLSVVYLGVLSSDRTALAQIESYMVLQPSGSISVLADFYHADDSDITLQSDPSASPTADQYLYLSENSVKVTRKMPSWLYGIKIFGEIFFDGEEISPDDGIVFGNSNAAGASSAALLRNSSYAVDRNTTEDWAAVANEKFVFGNQPQTVSAAPVSEYERHGDLVSWGR